MTKNAKFVIILYGIADRTIHSVEIRDNDVGLDKIKPAPGEGLVKLPMSRYVLYPGKLHELLP